MTPVETLAARIESGDRLTRQDIAPASHHVHVRDEVQIAVSGRWHSIGAAFAVYRSLLPGWDLRVTILETGGEHVCSIIGPAPGKRRVRPEYSGRAADPARALVAAALRAKAARDNE